MILKDNYETLNYTRDMRTIMDDNDLPLSTDALAKFERQLVKEEHNITEKGEMEAVASLRKVFDQLKLPGSGIGDQRLLERKIRLHLREIERLNMKAIVRKHELANNAVNKATLILGFAATFTFLVLFSFSVNFPGFIANPLKGLLEGIQEISQRNYNKRLNFQQNDEFAHVASAFNSMAERLNEWENSNLATVLSEKRRIEAIIEQMQDAIIGVDADGEILFTNDAARKTLSITQEKVIGTKADDIAKSNDLFRSILDKDQKILKPFKIVLDGRESYFELQTRDISVPNLDSQQGAIRTAAKSAGKVYILTNITTFKERDEAKTNFIATISHELKTPISSIRLSLKLLNDQRVGAINPEQRQLVDHISEDASRLLKITSELLELSQVETGNIQLNYIPAEPEQIVKYAVDSVKFQAEQKEVKLEVITAPGLPKVQVDVEKTAWVLVNFLSNALRYSSEKSRVVIQLAKRGGFVEFSVKDFGKGIDEQFQKRLFDRYFQVPTDGQNKSGSGLGLAISKDFIEVQQGKIGVESALGEGSRFYFQLPASEA
ncbi:PAS domain-containing sensor histidine kinase [Mucilaginibacter galii]|uniref:histidine kinase n=1 Tax=Mucilaginibacter galii TaxID=2005073 RepID=A0A917JFC8_9SPHI|nr:PAS domain-containing sensor histidine kinase [Mucilaginibacter galii]